MKKILPSLLLFFISCGPEHIPPPDDVVIYHIPEIVVRGRSGNFTMLLDHTQKVSEIYIDTIVYSSSRSTVYKDSSGVYWIEYL